MVVMFGTPYVLAVRLPDGRWEFCPILVEQCSYLLPKVDWGNKTIKFHLRIGRTRGHSEWLIRHSWQTLLLASSCPRLFHTPFYERLCKGMDYEAIELALELLDLVILLFSGFYWRSAVFSPAEYALSF